MSFPFHTETIQLNQTRLAQLQKTPVFGPALFSPIKMVLSIVELVAAVAMSIFLAIQGRLFHNSVAKAEAQNSIFFAGISMGNFLFSLANILTIGVLGYILITER